MFVDQTAGALLAKDHGSWLVFINEFWRAISIGPFRPARYVLLSLLVWLVLFSIIIRSSFLFDAETWTNNLTVKLPATRMYGQAKIEQAWSRVERKIITDAPSPIAAREFARFLGVFESNSGVPLPDSLLGVVPSKLDLFDETIIIFSHDHVNHFVNQGSELTLRIRRDPEIRELERHFDRISYRIVPNEKVISAPLDIGLEYPRRRYKELADGIILVGFFDGRGSGCLLKYDKENTNPDWSTKFAGHVAPPFNSTGPGLSESFIFEGESNVGVVSLQSDGISINVFTLQDGDIVASFATRPIDKRLIPDVQEYPVNNPDSED